MQPYMHYGILRHTIHKNTGKPTLKSFPPKNPKHLQFQTKPNMQYMKMSVSAQETQANYIHLNPRHKTLEITENHNIGI